MTLYPFFQEASILHFLRRSGQAGLIAVFRFLQIEQKQAAPSGLFFCETAVGKGGFQGFFNFSGLFWEVGEVVSGGGKCVIGPGFAASIVVGQLSDKGGGVPEKRLGKYTGIVFRIGPIDALCDAGALETVEL